jgi:hypothetical protein
MRERGSILLMSLLVLLVVSSLAVALLASTSALDGPARRRTERTRSFYLAQSGLERAIAEVFSVSGDWTTLGPVPVPETSYGPGSYRVTASLLQPDRARLTLAGMTAADSVLITVALERGPGGEVLVTEWDDPGAWGWAP